ncbi:MAG: BON domain-containing protein [Woeseia sp.]
MNTQSSKASRNKLATAVMVALSLGAGGTALAEGNTDYTGAVKDAWLDGRIETAFALNRHLNPFAIDTEVDNGVAYLTGTVESDIDRDLAGEIALNIDGVTKVENKLDVKEKSAMDKMAASAKQKTNSLMQSIDDATITASVKTRLMANGNTKGLSINVDTENEVVTLSGKVRSSEERNLAEVLAKNTDSVAKVNNKLTVSKQ